MTPFSPTASSPPLSAEAILQMKFVHITNAIDSCRANKFNSPAAVEALSNARMANIKLGPEYLIQGIAACGSSMRDLKTFDLAYWAFGVLKSEKTATMEVFENMMYICSKYGRVDSAAELMRDFFAAGYTYTSYLLSTYIILIANSGTQSEVSDLLEPLYVTYRVRLIHDIVPSFLHPASCSLPLSFSFSVSIGSVEPEDVRHVQQGVHERSRVSLQERQQRLRARRAAGPDRDQPAALGEPVCWAAGGGAAEWRLCRAAGPTELVQDQFSHHAA
jgi:hypothetical protein